jgi:hypothetical protein
MNSIMAFQSGNPATASVVDSPTVRPLILVLVICVCASIAFGQGANDYHKVEVYGGFSLARVESNVNSASFTSAGGTQTFTDLCSAATGQEIGVNSQKFFCTRRNFNGFDGSVTYNVSRYIGIKGDITGHFKTQSFVDKFTPPGVTQTLSNQEHLYNFLGGCADQEQQQDRAVQTIRSCAGRRGPLLQPPTADPGSVSAIQFHD